MNWLTPWIGRIAVVVIAVIAWALIPSPPGPTITLVYSPDAADIIEPAVAAFNATHATEVDLTTLSSGEAESKLADGSIGADAWMPAASAWADMLNAETGRVMVDTSAAPSAFWSPMAIVTWQGYDDELRNWHDIIRRSKRGGTIGPEHDNFRYGHTRPTKSTSGLFATLSEGTAMADAEQGVDFYADIGKYACEQIQSSNTRYFSATYMQETVMLDCIGQSSLGLVEVFPPKGTYIADYPCLTMAGGDGAHIGAAREFCDWLANNSGRFMTGTFRTGTPSPGETFRQGSHAVGDPEAEVLVLAPPSGDALLDVRNQWNAAKKEQDVLFLVDSCAAMTNNGRAALATDVVNNIAENLDPDTQIEVRTFANGTDTWRAPEPLASGERIQLPPPATSSTCTLYDAAGHALTDPSLRDAHSINTIVIVSAGFDSGSVAYSAANIDRQLTGLLDEASPPEVIAVSINSPSDTNAIGAWGRLPAPVPVKDVTQDNFEAETTDIWRSL